MKTNAKKETRQTTIRKIKQGNARKKNHSRFTFMETPVNSEIHFSHPLEWAVSYRDFIYQQYVPHYIASKERDSFLIRMKDDVASRVARVAGDSYLMDIVGIYQRGLHLRKPLSEILNNIEKSRQKFLEIHNAPIDYRELVGGLEEIDDFVEVGEPREIIKFLVRHGVENYFLSVILALEQARKRGGLREREEMDILRRAKIGERMNVANPNSENGFKWCGIKMQQRIDALHKIFIQKNFISRQTSVEQFRDIFSDKPIENRVTWLKTSKQLLLFIETFLDKEFISIPNSFWKKRNRIKMLSVSKARGKTTTVEESELRGLLHEVNHWLYPIIGACFKSKKGIPFSAKSLKHTRNDVFNKQKFPKSFGEFENLAREIASV